MRPAPTFTPPTLCDLIELADHIRPADAAELAAGFGMPPFESAAMSLRLSDSAFSARVNGRLLAVYGIRADSILDGTAVIWALGTRAAQEEWRTFARWSAPCLERLADTLPWAATLHNAVHAQNEASIRWLGWLGASFGNPFYAKPEGLPPAAFIPFSIERSDIRHV